MTNHARVAWQSSGRTSQLRQDDKTNLGKLSLAECMTMDQHIYQRMCCLSTDEKPDSLTKDLALSHSWSPVAKTFHANCNGPNHQITDKSQIQCNTYYSGPWMHLSSNIFTMPNHNYWTQDCATIPTTFVPLV